MNEQEEFEFRARAEAESQMAPHMPSSLAVAGNAAAKGVASIPDFWTNVATGPGAGAIGTVAKGVVAGVNYLRGDDQALDQAQRPARPNLARKALEKVGIIRAENEPQTGPQRILDTAVQAGVNTMLAPAQSIGQVAVNAGMGLISGGAAGLTKEGAKHIIGETGSDLLAMATGVLTPFAAHRLMNPPKTLNLNATETQTFTDARKEGFVTEPSRVRSPSSIKETVAGVAATAQNMAIKNQDVADKLTTRFLGLPEGTPLSRPALKDLRKQASKPYQDVSALSPDAATALEQLKQTRNDAQAAYRSYEAQKSPAFLAEYKRLSASADTWENVLEDIAKTAGRPELIPQLRASRQYIARTYDVERALNVGSGRVSLPKIGDMLQDGLPLSGEFALMGRFSKAFPRVAREIEGIPPAGVSGTNAASSAMLAAEGASSGGAVGMLAGGLPLLRGPARRSLLSEKYQNRLLQMPSSYDIAAIRGGLVGKSLMDYHDEVFK